ncbi:hypothetical protein FRC06_001766 [Ceratobasidium sp. 370]|nr:hypothetical protein FRC06_001766 [Ceratobasidium sp. 370]
MSLRKANIAYSSHFFFRVAIPYVWKELRGANNLFLLIPGVEMLRYWRTFDEIVLPDKASANFSRYRIYAPLVHSLRVFETPLRYYNISTWTTLSGYLGRLGGTLLPNLKQLAIHCETCPVADRINWIAIFLAPSLLEIQFVAGSINDVLGVPDSRASALFELITQRCPSIQSLSLFPEPDDQHEPVGPDIIPSAPTIMSFEHVANMQSLRTLIMSKYVLQPNGLMSIGLLPALEKLEVQETMLEPTFIVFSAQLPEFLFPSLRYLTLQMINSFEIVQIWQMDPLVRGLTHVQINAVPPELEFPLDDADSAGIIDCLPQIFQNSFHVQSLSIDFDSEGLSDSGNQILHVSALTSALQLPLQSLTLSTIEIDDFDDFCERLEESCPKLRRLQILSQTLFLFDLSHITRRLKQLEHLSVEVYWYHLPEPEEQTYSSDALISLEYNNLDSSFLDVKPGVSAKDIAM